MTGASPLDESKREAAGGAEPVAPDPYRGADPIPALARFFLAAVWTAGVFWACSFVYTLLPGHYLIPDLLFRIFSSALTAGGFCFFLRVLDYSREPLLPALGLPLRAVAVRRFFSGIWLGALLISVYAVAVSYVGTLHLHLHLSRHMELRAVGGVAVLLAGALLEELAFRGYPFQKLVEALGPAWAVVVLSALFGAGHLANPDARGWLSWGFFNTVAVGVLLALARLRTGSLWFPIGLHFSWNLFEGTVFGFPVSGIRDFATVVRSTAGGARWVTGGAYGPEASAICTVVLVAAVPVLLWMTGPPRMKHER